MSVFKIDEANDLRFYMLPKALFFSLKYLHLSLEAKVAYAFLLDRMELSRENNWVNENGEIYLLFARENLAELLDCSVDTVTKVMKELTRCGLVREKRQGLGKPNIIFVCHIDVDENAEYYRTRKNQNLDSKNIVTNDTENNHTDHDKENGANSGEVRTTPSLIGKIEPKDADVLTAISYYFKVYQHKRRKKHQIINKQQHERVYAEISTFMYEYSLDLESMGELIKKHFERTYSWKVDYNINHFANEEILKNCMYDAGLY